MDQTYDFVIVGGGPAGTILAYRLASLPSKPSVVLIEAGAHNKGTKFLHTYDRFALTFVTPELDYGYLSTPQPHLGDRQINMWRGKGLGGSTQTNFQVWSLGGRDEFDTWAKAVDGPEWGFDSVQANLRQFENLTVELPADMHNYVELTPSAHGFTGEVDVSIGGAIEGEMKYTLDAGVEAGYRLNKDPNDGDLIGVGLLPTTNKKGYRTTAASAFLKDGKHVPSNLTIVPDTTIVKILFDGDRAIGVRGASGTAAFANKEVILTAGAIDTPKLLLLSGIGPRAHLESLGIEVKADLLIGQNLVDHPCVPLTYHMGPGFSQRMHYSRDPAGLEVARRQLDDSGSGLLTKLYSSNTLVFLKKDELYKSAEFAALSNESKKLLPLETVPSFEFAIGGPLIPPDYVFDDASDSYLNFFVTLMNSQSRGEVTLASADPADKPVINPRYLTNPYDGLVFKEAMREALRYVEAPSLQKFIKKPILAPASNEDSEIEGFISAAAVSLNHPSCTVRMGSKDDPTTCVDHDLKVHGLRGLRVADLSVPPELPSGHPQIIAYAIGQIAAKKIQKDWNL